MSGQPGDFGFQSFNLLVLLSDLSFLLSLLLTQLLDHGVELTNRRLPLVNFRFPLCFALDRTSMQRPPVMGLLTQFDQLHAVDVIRDDRHATMVRKVGMRVQ